MDRYSYEGAFLPCGLWPKFRLEADHGFLIFDGRVGHSPEHAIAGTADRYAAETIVAALNAAETRP